MSRSEFRFGQHERRRDSVSRRIRPQKFLTASGVTASESTEAEVDAAPAEVAAEPSADQLSNASVSNSLSANIPPCVS